MRAGRRVLALAIAPLAIAAAVHAAAAPKGKVVDRFWEHPGYAKLEPASIAMLPPVSFTGDLQAEKLADGIFAQSLRGTGYRWMSGTTSRVMLARPGEGDSLLKALRESVQQLGRVDSLLAPALCRKLRVAAVLSLQIERWEQLEIEFNQSGRPSTTVSMRAALVDSAGRLLWSAAGSEVGEGPYHDPTAAVVGVKSSGLGTQPITGQGGPPSYAEVVTTLAARWGPHFPARAAAASAPADSAR